MKLKVLAMIIAISFMSTVVYAEETGLNADKAKSTAKTKQSVNSGKSANLAACTQNCQRQYDAKIKNCAGYKVGNSAQACKNPIARDKESCLNSCR